MTMNGNARVKGSAQGWTAGKWEERMGGASTKSTQNTERKKESERGDAGVEGLNLAR